MSSFKEWLLNTENFNVQAQSSVPMQRQAMVAKSPMAAKPAIAQIDDGRERGVYNPHMGIPVRLLTHDEYHGKFGRRLSRKLGFDQVITPDGIVHNLEPSEFQIL